MHVWLKQQVNTLEEESCERKEDMKIQFLARMSGWDIQGQNSETGQIRFERARFQTPSSVSFFGRGKVGVYKVQAHPREWGWLEGTNPKVLPPQKKSLKLGIWSSHFSRDLSQVVRRTPQDTPVPLYTRTSPSPIKYWPSPSSRGESSVSSSQPIICVPKRTHRVPPRMSSLFVLSARFLQAFSKEKLTPPRRTFAKRIERKFIGGDCHSVINYTKEVPENYNFLSCYDNFA